MGGGGVWAYLKIGDVPPPIFYLLPCWFVVLMLWCFVSSPADDTSPPPSPLFTLIFSSLPPPPPYCLAEVLLSRFLWPCKLSYPRALARTRTHERPWWAGAVDVIAVPFPADGRRELSGLTEELTPAWFVVVNQLKNSPNDFFVIFTCSLTRKGWKVQAGPSSSKTFERESMELFSWQLHCCQTDKHQGPGGELSPSIQLPVSLCSVLRQ